jgi:hypothetical protein
MSLPSWAYDPDAPAYYFKAGDLVPPPNGIGFIFGRDCIGIRNGDHLLILASDNTCAFGLTAGTKDCVIVATGEGGSLINVGVWGDAL